MIVHQNEASRITIAQAVMKIAPMAQAAGPYAGEALKSLKKSAIGFEKALHNLQESIETNILRPAISTYSRATHPIPRKVFAASTAATV